MNNIIISTGGTGGIIPAQILYDYLKDKKIT